MLSEFWTQGTTGELSLIARSDGLVYHALDGLGLIYLNIPDHLSPLL